MVTGSSVYLALGSGWSIHMETRVNAPILPVYITRMMTSLPAADRPGVIPVESPTVPKAEITSNRSWIKVQSGSRTHIRKVATHTTPSDRLVYYKLPDKFSQQSLYFYYKHNRYVTPTMHRFLEVAQSQLGTNQTDAP